MNNKLPCARFLIVAFALIGMQAHGQTSSDEGPVTAYYINGVYNDPMQAQVSSIELARAWSSQAGQRSGIRFTFVYNPTDGFLEDVVEAGNQSGINTTLALAMLWGVTPKTVVFRDRLLELVAYSMTQPAVTDALVEQFAEEFRNSMRRSTADYYGHKIILIAHSQGNFFANAAYDRLDDSQRPCAFVVGVATPDSRVPPLGRWSTLQRDRVIQAAAAARFQAGLETLNQLVPHDPINEPGLLDTAHGFVESYLAHGSQARAEILENINAARRAARPDGSACARIESDGPGGSGPRFSFVLRESSAQLMAQASCEQELISCPPYYTGVVSSLNEAAAGASHRVDANTNYVSLRYDLSGSGTGISVNVGIDHVINSVAAPGPGGELYYPFGGARSQILARWTLNATGFDRNGNPFTGFTYRFTGSASRSLTTVPDPQFIPDETEDFIGGIWLCPLPRLYFVNVNTGSSFITTVGDASRDFDQGGSIATGQYEVTLVAGGDQLALASGQMDDGVYPSRQLICRQQAQYRLQITPPMP